MNTTLDNSKDFLTNGSLKDLTAKLPKSFKAPYFLAKRLNDAGKLPARARFYTEGIINRVIHGGYQDEHVREELQKMVGEYEAGVLVQ